MTDAEQVAEIDAKLAKAIETRFQVVVEMARRDDEIQGFVHDLRTLDAAIDGLLAIRHHLAPS